MPSARTLRLRRGLLSSQAEEVVHRLHIGSALLGRVGSNPAGLRISTSAMGPPEVHNIQAFLVPMVLGVAEDFAKVRLFESVERPGTPAVNGADSWVHAKARASASWGGLYDGWREWCDVDVSEFGNIEAFKAWVQVRNALVHGAGKLSRRQQGNQRELVEAFAELDVSFQDQILRLGDGAAESLLSTVLGFVCWLDGRSWQFIDLRYEKACVG